MGGISPACVPEWLRGGDQDLLCFLGRVMDTGHLFTSFCAPSEPVIMPASHSRLAGLSYPSEGVQGFRAPQEMARGQGAIHSSALRSTYNSQGILHSY